MANDKYSQGGRFAPHRYNNGNVAYNPIVKDSGLSTGCLFVMLVALTIIISYFVYIY